MSVYDLISTFDLPDRAFARIPERDQNRLVQRDALLRIIWNEQWKAYGVVRRCKPSESAEWIAGQRYPGWYGVKLFPKEWQYDIEDILIWQREADVWALHDDRATAIDKAWDQHENVRWREQEKQEATDLSDATDHFFDKMDHSTMAFSKPAAKVAPVEPEVATT